MPKHQMLINYVPGEECRIAIVEDGRLEELYQERASTESHVGNIYKGRVVNVEPSIQAAFIDFGLERNGFLHITDVHPKFFPGDAKEETEQVGLKTPRRDRPPIQRCFRRGQEILVQVLKEGIGTKGPTLTSYLSIPGRFLVMMPDMERLGVSRKVEDDEARREMRRILDDLKPPEGFGFIIRTAGIGQSKTELKRDLAYLTRLWKSIDQRRKSTPRVGELYAESDLVIRTLRDIYTSDIERIIIDNEAAARRAFEYLSVASPRSMPNVVHYKDPIPLFHRYGIEQQIENINARNVPLPSGGYLVIDSTEALVAIDVNSGKSRDHADAEMMAYRTNQEAVDEICRQLRLRDLGGVIVNDLIDMHSAKHRRDIETRFRENLKRDRAKTKSLSISQFGLLEMTRQRMRPSLKKSLYSDCPSCKGAGHVKNGESVVLDVMRRLALVLSRTNVARVELTVSGEVAFQLLNRKRGQLVDLEQNNAKGVLVRVYEGGGIDFVSIAAFDARGGAVEAEAINNLPEPVLEQVTGETPELEAEDEAPTTESGDGEMPPETSESSENSRSARASNQTSDGESSDAQGAAAAAPSDENQDEEGARGGRRRRRRGGRGRGRGKNRAGEMPVETAEISGAPQAADESGAVAEISSDQASGFDGEAHTVNWSERPVEPEYTPEVADAGPSINDPSYTPPLETDTPHALFSESSDSDHAPIGDGEPVLFADALESQDQADARNLSSDEQSSENDEFTSDSEDTEANNWGAPDLDEDDEPQPFVPGQPTARDAMGVNVPPVPGAPGSAGAPGIPGAQGPDQGGKRRRRRRGGRRRRGRGGQGGEGGGPMQGGPNNPQVQGPRNPMPRHQGGPQNQGQPRNQGQRPNQPMQNRSPQQNLNQPRHTGGPAPRPLPPQVRPAPAAPLTPPVAAPAPVPVVPSSGSRSPHRVYPPPASSGRRTPRGPAGFTPPVAPAAPIAPIVPPSTAVPKSPISRGYRRRTSPPPPSFPSGPSTGGSSGSSSEPGNSRERGSE